MDNNLSTEKLYEATQTMNTTMQATILLYRITLFLISVKGLKPT
jgi:hypothetical protein